MRIVYIDIDSLRPDHLSCYGYPRKTSPNIDRIADKGVRFTNCYASDMPCAPSRMAMFSGRFGYHNGAVCHYGRRADPYMEFQERGFRESPLTDAMWVNCLKRTGMHTVTISPFAARHGLYHFLTGFRECHDPGGYGHGVAEDVTPRAIEWLETNGKDDNWFLHVNYWDVHIPYQMPESFDSPFKDDPPHDWINEDLLADYITRPGRRSFRDAFITRNITKDSKWQPREINSLSNYKIMQNSYDAAINYTDRHVGLILEKLEELGVMKDTAVVVTADHGEDLGEAGIIGHGFASHHTGRIPFILYWPGATQKHANRADGAFHYQFDLAATILELLGIEIPKVWDGQSFASTLQKGEEGGRDFLVLSQLAQAVQRSVRFSLNSEQYIFSRTWFGFFHDLPEGMLFNISQDPFTIQNTAEENPDTVGHAKECYTQWLDEMKQSFPGENDPMQTVLEDAIMNFSSNLDEYAERLGETGRESWAERVTDLL